jgi:hypothetical protein
MTTVLSALTALTFGTLASISTQRFVAIVYPGLQSMCRWVVVSAAVAASVLGGMAALVGAFTSLGAANDIALACGVALLTQIVGWLLFLHWLLPAMSVRSTTRRIQPVHGYRAAFTPAAAK